MIFDKELFSYWLKWKYLELSGYPLYTYFWFMHAYKTRKRDVLIIRKTRQIESKYKLLFTNLDLDWNGYLNLVKARENEISNCINSIQ